MLRASHQGKRAIKELITELAPKPDVAPSIRKVPQQKVQARTNASSESRPAREERTPSGRSSSVSPRNLAPKPRDHRAKVEPLAPARFIVQFTTSAELRDKLSRLEALMPGRDLAAMVDVAVSEKLERLEAKRFGTTDKPRKNLEDADTSPGSIPSLRRPR